MITRLTLWTHKSFFSCSYARTADTLQNMCSMYIISPIMVRQRGVFVNRFTDVGLALECFPVYVVLPTTAWLSLRWRHNGCDSVSNHQPHHCLLNHLFRRRSKKTSKLRVTGLCAGNSPGTGEFSAQMASNVENVSIWWRHHVMMSWHGNVLRNKFTLWGESVGHQ